MGQRAWVLLLVLLVLALQDSHAVTFIHPRSRIVLSGPRGVDVPVQTKVLRHADNRAFDLSVYQDGMRVHRWQKSIDSEYDHQLFPIEPIYVRLTPGSYELVASVYGAEKLRGRAVLTVKVCGGDDC